MCNLLHRIYPKCYSYANMNNIFSFMVNMTKQTFLGIIGSFIIVTGGERVVFRRVFIRR